MRSAKVYLSLGGNEGFVLSGLKQALALLSDQKEITDFQFSHFYSTAPMQVNSPLWFVNAVCSFQTLLTPSEIFNITKAIEIRLGKVSKPKNASRPIDIDFLFYGDQIIQKEELEIPHPRWMERLFVLVPLADLTQEIILHRTSEEKNQHFLLQDLIDPLLTQSSQSIYLLEKNPDLQ